MSDVNLTLSGLVRRGGDPFAIRRRFARALSRRVPGPPHRVFSRSSRHVRSVAGPRSSSTNLHTMSSHLEPRWSAAMFRVWGSDPRAEDPNGEPFKIDMQGVGVFACRRAAWPGSNSRLTGLSSEEGYIQESFVTLVDALCVFHSSAGCIALACPPAPAIVMIGKTESATTLSSRASWATILTSCSAISADTSGPRLRIP